MKRDPDLIREILLDLEQHPSPAPRVIELLRKCEVQETRVRHIILAEEAGLFTYAADPPEHNYGYLFSSIRLTNAGYDFLDVIRTDSGWSRLKARAAVAGGHGLQVLVAMAAAVAAETVKQG